LLARELLWRRHYRRIPQAELTRRRSQTAHAHADQRHNTDRLRHLAAPHQAFADIGGDLGD